MRVFVATDLTQGQFSDDFHHTPVGELVGPPLPCDTDTDAGGRCGCRRAFVGVTTLTSTTTAQVVDRDHTPDTYADALYGALVTAGLVDGGAESRCESALVAESFARSAAGLLLGTVVGIRDDLLVLRAHTHLVIRDTRSDTTFAT